MTSRPEIRPATNADLEAFYGVRPPATVRALVAELDGELVGIGGIEYVGRQRIAFCWVKPGLKVYPLVIARAARQVLKMANGAPVIAFGDPEEPTSDRFLSRLGFEKRGAAPQGEVYVHE